MSLLKNLSVFDELTSEKPRKKPVFSVKLKKTKKNTNLFPFSSFQCIEKSLKTPQSARNSMESNEIMSPKFQKSLNSSKKNSEITLKKSRFPLKLGYFAFIRYEIKKKLRISLNKNEEFFDIGIRAFIFEMDILNIVIKLKKIGVFPFIKQIN